MALNSIINVGVRVLGDEMSSFAKGIAARQGGGVAQAFTVDIRVIETYTLWASQWVPKRHRRFQRGQPASTVPKKG